MPESITSIPTFADYVQDSKYIKNVSPKTLAWYKDVERVFGSVDIHNVRPSLRQFIHSAREGQQARLRQFLAQAYGPT